MNLDNPGGKVVILFFPGLCIKYFQFPKTIIIFEH